MVTNYLANQFLNELCGRSSVNFGASAYVGLSTTAPTITGTNVTEPSGNGYARVLIGTQSTAATYKMAAAANGAITNDQIIYFPEATGNWGTCTHFCIFSAVTGGNLLAYGELETSITPAANTVPLVRVGELDISLT